MFATPGSNGDKIHANIYTVGLEVAGFLYL